MNNNIVIDEKLIDDAIGYFNSDAGSFTNSITGSGNITLGNLPVQPVPEPATILGTLISASFGVGLRRRSKQQRKTIVKA